MKPQNSTVIIPVRREYDMVQLCLKYAQLNSTTPHNYIILFDNPDEKGIETIEGLIIYGNVEVEALKPQKNEDRVGLMKLVESGIKRVSTKYFFYFHADMVPGPCWDKEMFKYMPESTDEYTSPRVTVCGTRIEPSIFPADKAKYQADCGISANDFNYQKFKAAYDLFYEDKVGEGFFAPHLFRTDEWIGYDMRFWPQSREETDLAMSMLERGYRLLNSRGALFYHFAGRGSRRKDSLNVDSEEWKQSNYKNERNFIRKWRQPIITNEYCAPVRLKYDETVSIGMIVGYKDVDRVYEWLRLNEPFFDKVYICIDSRVHPGKVRDQIDRYIEDESNTCKLFDPTKVEVIVHHLNDDFAEQRNQIVRKNKCDWLLMLDADEYLQPNGLYQFREIVRQVSARPNTKVVGFPRANFIDGRQTPVYPDYQFRLIRRSMSWQNRYPEIGASPGCHEIPIPVQKELESVVVLKEPNVIHPKTRDVQKKQKEYYERIGAKKAYLGPNLGTVC